MQDQDNSDEAVLIRYYRQVNCLMTETLIAAGCYNHCGQWRRARSSKGASTMNTKQLLDVSKVKDVMGSITIHEEVRQKVEQANSADAQAQLDLLAGCNNLSEYRSALSNIGDLAYHALAQRLNQLHGESARGMRLATIAKLADIEKQLIGENPSPLERLLAERIAMCWLDVQDHELRYANLNSESTHQQFEWRSRMLDRAQKRYLSAIKDLATVRRLNLPIVQLNIGENQVNMVGGGDGAKELGGGVTDEHSTGS
jgi:hypothetical protein